MQTVRFTRMQDGSREEYALIEERSRVHERGLVDRVLGSLRDLEGFESGYRIDRYQHSLQTATRALRDGADEETVVCALLHDIGDNLAPHNHGAFAAGVLRPYVSYESYWMVDKHPVFQGYFFWHHLDLDRDARERYRGHPCFERTALFCERWDQTAFDPAYDTLPLDAFEPMVRRTFARTPWSDATRR